MLGDKKTIPKQYSNAGTQPWIGLVQSFNISLKMIINSPSTDSRILRR